MRADKSLRSAGSVAELGLESAQGQPPLGYGLMRAAGPAAAAADAFEGSFIEGSLGSLSHKPRETLLCQ